MAIRNLQDVFNNKRQRLTFVFKSPSANAVGSFLEKETMVNVDAVISEDHSLTTRMTDVEIEDGSVLTDHIHLLPQTIQITAIMSESPLSFGSEVTNGLISSSVLRPLSSGIKKFVGSVVGGVTNSYFGEDRTDIQRNFWQNFLKARWKDKKPFSIITAVDTIENVFFESIDFSKTIAVGDSIEFSCTLKEIRYVRSEVSITGQKPSASKLTNRGTVQGVLEDVTTSFARRGAEAIGVSGENFDRALSFVKDPRIPNSHHPFIKSAVDTSLQKAKSVTIKTIKNLLAGAFN